MRVFRPNQSLALEGFRFALTGLSSYLLYVLLFYILSRRIGIDEYASLVVTYMSAAVLYFVASKYFTFTSRDRDNIPVEILRFILLLCLTTLVNWVLMLLCKGGFSLGRLHRALYWYRHIVGLELHCDAHVGLCE